MKPSSKICLLGVLAVAAFWPAAGEAGAAGRSSIGAARFDTFVRRHVAARRLGHGHSRGFAFADALPTYWDGALPGYYAPGSDYASAAPVNERWGPPPPIFYPVPVAGLTNPCAAPRRPLVIEIAPSKPARKLPRIVYGTSSLCGG